MATTPSESDIQNYLNYQNAKLNAGGDPFGVIKTGTLNAPVNYDDPLARQQAISALNAQQQNMAGLGDDGQVTDQVNTWQTAANTSPQQGLAGGWNDPNWQQGTDVQLAFNQARQAASNAGYANPKGITTIGGTMPGGSGSGLATFNQVPASTYHSANPVATPPGGNNGLATAGMGMNESGGATTSMAGYGGNGSNLGFGSGPTNPYLGQQAQAIANQMGANWNRSIDPSIRSGAMAAGGYGGSRQGVVEANGLNDMSQSLGNSLSNLYGTAWSQQQSNNLQQQSLNNSYDLGLRSSDLGYANLDANIAQNNSNNQLNYANFGLNAYNTMNGQTTAGINAGTQIQNTPLDYQKYFTNSANGVGSGYATGTTSTTNPGNALAGALGGFNMGSAYGNTYGVSNNGYSSGTGSAYGGTTTDGVFTPYRQGM